VASLWEAAARPVHRFLPETYWEGERVALIDSYLPRARTLVSDASGLSGFISLIGTEIAGLFVAPSAQGHGVGRALLAAAQPLVLRPSLEVFALNLPARRFYAHVGFAEVAQRLDPDTGEILIQMVRQD